MIPPDTSPPGGTPSRLRLNRRRLLVGLGSVACVAAAGAWTAMPHPSPALRERLLRCPDWSDGRFHNREPLTLWTNGHRGPPLRRYFLERGEREPARDLPTWPLDPSSLGSPPAGALRALWLGHSTVLLDLDGVRLLVDPVWATRASPVQGVGPRRFLPPPVALQDLPLPDHVLLSHDHYDHLDQDTVLHLARRGVPFLAPLGVGERLRRWGVSPSQVREVEWDETVDLGGVQVTAVPALHFSGRGAFDRYRTLWCAYALVGPSHRVFFGGDGGYCGAFAQAGRQWGPFDMAFLEIGAWDEAWAQVHLGPDNAIRARADLGARWLIPIHWGTFNLAFHPWYEPAERLSALAAEAGVPVAFPMAGQILEAGGALPEVGWWRASRAG